MKRRSKPDLTPFPHRCPHCGHEWKSLMAKPERCKKCKQPMEANNKAAILGERRHR